MRSSPKFLLFLPLCDFTHGSGQSWGHTAFPPWTLPHMLGPCDWKDALGSGLLGTVVPSLPAPTLLPGSPHRLSGHRGMGAGLGSPAPHGPGFRAHLSVAPRGLQSPAPVWWGHGEPWGAWWGCDCRTAPSPRGAPALGPNSCRRRAPDSSGPSGGGSVQACHPRRTLTHAGLQRLPPGMCQQLPRLRVL